MHKKSKATEIARSITGIVIGLLFIFISIGAFGPSTATTTLTCSHSLETCTLKEASFFGSHKTREIDIADINEALAERVVSFRRKGPKVNANNYKVFLITDNEDIRIFPSIVKESKSNETVNKVNQFLDDESTPDIKIINKCSPQDYLFIVIPSLLGIVIIFLSAFYGIAGKNFFDYLKGA